MSDNAKTYTLKTVTTEINRVKKTIDTKTATVKKLTEELKAEKKALKELEAIYNALYQESLQKQIADSWFKSKSMTPEQIKKFIDLGARLHDKIDVLDVDDMVNAVTAVYNEQQPTASDNAQKVDTYINFSENKDQVGAENENISRNA